MRNTGPTLETKRAVIGREGGRCFRCGKPLALWDGVEWVPCKPYSIHHRKPRGMGGTRDPEINSSTNLILLCGSGTTGCHGWVESRRATAKNWGLLLSKHVKGRNRVAYSEYRDTWIDLETGRQATD